MRSETPGLPTGVVRGELLHWARIQQERTMRWVRDQGGPSPGYQCEVEQGSKTEVRTDLLAAWTRALGVTESFARGQVPVYTRQPQACRGLAGHVVARVAQHRTSWKLLSPMERIRRVLRLIMEEPTPLPRVVLAHTLGLELTSFEALLAGQMPIMPGLRRAVAELTTLHDGFFHYGELESGDDHELIGRYLPALRLAQRAGITPEELEKLASSRLDG